MIMLSSFCVILCILRVTLTCKCSFGQFSAFFSCYVLQRILHLKSFHKFGFYLCVTENNSFIMKIKIVTTIPFVLH